MVVHLCVPSDWFATNSGCYEPACRSICFLFLASHWTDGWKESPVYNCLSSSSVRLITVGERGAGCSNIVSLYHLEVCIVLVATFQYSSCFVQVVTGFHFS